MRESNHQNTKHSGATTFHCISCFYVICFLKIWLVNHLQQNHPKSLFKFRFLGSIPDLLIVISGARSRIIFLTSTWGDSSVWESLPSCWVKKWFSGKCALDLQQQPHLGAHSVVSSVAQLCPTLRPHGLQHARLPCPSPTAGACSNSCPSSWWCHPSISSFCLQSFPASGCFPVSQFFALVAKVLEFQLQHQSFQWVFRTGFTVWKGSSLEMQILGP